jgi:endonuclease III
VDAFNTFIALMLSSQTKDQVVGEAVENLKASPGGLTVDSILAMSDEVGFPKQFP